MNPASAEALLEWPGKVPAEVAQRLVDMHMALSFELGPRATWQAWQRQRLADMAGWLAQDATWRAWLAPGIDDALQRLPVMRRADYREMIRRAPPRVPPSFGPLGVSETSGSSGVPIRFHFSALARRVNHAVFQADDRRQRRDPRATVAMLTVQPQPVAGAHQHVPGDAWLHPGAHLLRDSASFTIEQNARWLCEQAPRYLSTYPALLSGLLSMIELHGLDAPSIEQIMTFAETVDAELRERAREILGARIVDRYSCDEIGPIAFQCPASDAHYHVAVVNAIVEVVDPQGRPCPEGERGSVLVTGLHQWASPALRYELGDVAALRAHCPACGATVPTLTDLLGRRRVLIERASGELFYVRVQAKHWIACSPVTEWRMLQQSPLDFRVEVVAPRALSDAEHTAIRAMLARQIGDEFRFDIVQLPAIVWPPGRKRQEILGLAAQREAAT